MINKGIGISCIILVSLTLLTGSLVTIHATSPHACTRVRDHQGHAVVHECRHGPTTMVIPSMDVDVGGSSTNKLTYTEDALPGIPPFECDGCNDGTGCICQWTCLIDGAFRLNKEDSFLHQDLNTLYHKISKYGLFYSGIK